MEYLSYNKIVRRTAIRVRMAVLFQAGETYALYLLSVSLQIFHTAPTKFFHVTD
jgi:hypothetical protein